MVQKFPAKFPEIPKTVRFPKCESFKKNSGNSGLEIEGAFHPTKNSGNFGQGSEWNENFPQ